MSIMIIKETRALQDVYIPIYWVDIWMIATCFVQLVMISIKFDHTNVDFNVRVPLSYLHLFQLK